jgi:hypothetical protein
MARSEHTVLHIRESETGLVSAQIVFARKLDCVDRWGKILTAAMIACTVGLPGARLVYLCWQECHRDAHPWLRPVRAVPARVNHGEGVA